MPRRNLADNRTGPGGRERRCKLCRRWLPLDSAHYHDAHGGQSYQTDCKACHAVRVGLRRRRQSIDLARVFGLLPR